MKCNLKSNRDRTSDHNRRWIAPSAVAATAAALAWSIANAAPFYNDNGEVCYFKLPPDEFCLELEIVEDGCLEANGIGNSMGGTQTRLAVTTFVGGPPVYAVALAVGPETIDATANDGNGEFWSGAVVTRAEWNAGFPFPGSAGLWTPPATAGTFDQYFGTEAPAAAVFWADATIGSAPIPPGATEDQFYYGPADLDNMSARRGAVLLGDGQVVSEPDVRLGHVSALGLAFSAFGAAEIETEDGALTLCCIGSSGKDGISLEPLCYLDETDWIGEAGIGIQTSDPISFAGAPSPMIQTTMRGPVGAVADAVIGFTRLQGTTSPAGQGIEATIDFSPVGATRLEVALFNAAGALVAEYETDNPLTMVITEEGVPSFRSDVRCERTGDASIVDLGDEVEITDSLSGAVFQNVRRIQATALDIATPASAVTSLEITGDNLAPITIDRVHTWHFGEWFEAEGIATISGADIGAGPALYVGNIGSSGQDGVRVNLDDDGFTRADGVILVFETPSACGDISPPPPLCDPDNASLILAATGRAGGTSGADLGEMRFQRSGAAGTTTWDIVADYTAVGSTSHQVEVYDDGALVGMVTGVPTGFVTTVGDLPKGCGKGEVQIGGVDTSCYRSCWMQDQAFAVGGAVFVGDELRVLAEAPAAPLEQLESFSIRGTELWSLVITDATVDRAAPCIADLDGDGAVGSPDLAAMLGGWGAPGPADLDGSGAVGSGDLAILLGGWGPCD